MALDPGAHDQGEERVDERRHDTTASRKAAFELVAEHGGRYPERLVATRCGRNVQEAGQGGQQWMRAAVVQTATDDASRTGTPFPKRAAM